MQCSFRSIDASIDRMVHGFPLGAVALARRLFSSAVDTPAPDADVTQLGTGSDTYASRNEKKPFALDMSKFYATAAWGPEVAELHGYAHRAPTALQWLRSRGPRLPVSLMQKLFTQGRVRVLDASGHSRRINRNRALGPGDRLLVPLESVQFALDRLAERQQGLLGRVDPEDIELMRRSVLFRDDHVLVINKPPGLATQRGNNISKAADDCAVAAFSDSASGVRPRLVHRLDQDVSGCLAFGTTQTSTYWLARAFKSKTRMGEAQAGDPSAGRLDSREYLEDALRELRQRHRARELGEEAGLSPDPARSDPALFLGQEPRSLEALGSWRT